MKEVEKHYRTKEAATLIGVHPKTLGRWIRIGDIAPVVAISQTDIRIPAGVLQTFLDQRTIRRGKSAL